MFNMTIYKFEPLKESRVFAFSDDSELILPPGTYYVGYEKTDDFLNVYIRIKPGDVGLGTQHLASTLVSELEENILKLCPVPYSPSP